VGQLFPPNPGRREHALTRRLGAEEPAYPEVAGTWSGPGRRRYRSGEPDGIVSTSMGPAGPQPHSATGGRPDRARPFGRTATPLLVQQAPGRRPGERFLDDGRAGGRLTSCAHGILPGPARQRVHSRPRKILRKPVSSRVIPVQDDDEPSRSAKLENLTAWRRAVWWGYLGPGENRVGREAVAYRRRSTISNGYYLKTRWPRRRLTKQPGLGRDDGGQRAQRSSMR